jgi:hypothetical protein
MVLMLCVEALVIAWGWTLLVVAARVRPSQEEARRLT